MSGTQEIEVRFLEINKEELEAKLKSLGAEDLGEDYFKEILFNHTDPNWSDNKRKFIRIRQKSKGAVMTYKHRTDQTVVGTKEIEFGIDNVEKVQLFLEETGWEFVRFVEKKRHSFKLGNVEVDIDLFPKAPYFVELEGESEEDLKEAAKKLELDWKNVEFRDGRAFLKEVYKIPLDDLKYFTFDKVE